ncbi:tryptophan--tRNA ligase [Candidatus Gracilibacteria bacterium]|nr:tryptophan--tRNA ligase [Candidatus Gracilibacteria bacterium]
MKRILTGVKPTGNGMHIGNYLGMYKPFVEKAQGNEAFLFLPDYHSLTSVHDGEVLKHNKHRLAAELFALMPHDIPFYVFEQSKIKHINNMTWILSSITPYSLMLRAHSFKDSQNKNSDINMAVFNYPILMAADIIGYDVDMVPVGKDQKQHLEFARDIAESFNKTYKTEFFKLPEAYIDDNLATIPGIDGRKMSKSYNNFIGIFDDEKVLKKQIMSIVTDDTPLEDPKNPETCNVFALMKFFAPEQRLISISNNYKAGGYGYGHAKLELLDILLTYFSEARKKYDSYMKDYSLIEKELVIGNKKAGEIHDKKYQKLKKIVGL